ncbi:hypothetical protein HDU76_006919 [Blyttiomyces sp. JEL0837]|nr:hypothetical protein HDU76_006919 [Blyttiomyces sp. JEL0837]
MPLCTSLINPGAETEETSHITSQSKEVDETVDHDSEEADQVQYQHRETFRDSSSTESSDDAIAVGNKFREHKFTISNLEQEAHTFANSISTREPLAGQTDFIASVEGLTEANSMIPPALGQRGNVRKSKFEEEVVQSTTVHELDINKPPKSYHNTAQEQANANSLFARLFNTDADSVKVKYESNSAIMTQLSELALIIDEIEDILELVDTNGIETQSTIHYNNKNIISMAQLYSQVHGLRHWSMQHKTPLLNVLKEMEQRIEGLGQSADIIIYTYNLRRSKIMMDLADIQKGIDESKSLQNKLSDLINWAKALSLEDEGIAEKLVSRQAELNNAIGILNEMFTKLEGDISKMMKLKMSFWKDSTSMSTNGWVHSVEEYETASGSSSEPSEVATSLVEKRGQPPCFDDTKDSIIEKDEYVTAESGDGTVEADEGYSDCDDGDNDDWDDAMEDLVVDAADNDGICVGRMTEASAVDETNYHDNVDDGFIANLDGYGEKMAGKSDSVDTLVVVDMDGHGANEPQSVNGTEMAIWGGISIEESNGRLKQQDRMETRSTLELSDGAQGDKSNFNIEENDTGGHRSNIFNTNIFDHGTFDQKAVELSKDTAVAKLNECCDELSDDDSVASWELDWFISQAELELHKLLERNSMIESELGEQYRS